MLRLHMATLLVKAREFGDESVADMAQRTGISRSTLHRLATGTKQPSLATLWTLRDAYSVRLDALVYDDPQTMRDNRPPHGSVCLTRTVTASGAGTSTGTRPGDGRPGPVPGAPARMRSSHHPLGSADEPASLLSTHDREHP